MKDVRIEVPTLHINISPVAFHLYASEFLNAAESFKKTNAYSPVPYYLYSKSIELSLKAFLLTKDVTMNAIKNKIGHDLEKALNKSVSLGLEDIVGSSVPYKDNIQKANNYYKSKEFEYFGLSVLKKALRAYPDLPDLKVLSEFASALVSKLQQICIKAMNGQV